MAVKLLEKPFLSAALLCAFAFYSGLVKLAPRNPFRSLLPADRVSSVEGLMISSPVRASSGRYYSAKMSLSRVRSASPAPGAAESLLASASGVITVYIPSKLVEAYFPGKLYSRADGGGAFLYESGAEYRFSGRFLGQKQDSAMQRQPVFLADSCSYCRWREGFFGRTDRIRAVARLQFRRLMYAWGEGGGLLLALLSGSREYLDEDVYASFRNSGLSHIIALSGMHLSMFSAIAFFFASRFNRKRLVFWVRLIALVCFVWFAGFSPSLLRAFICSMLLLFSAAAGIKEPDMLLILSFSFLLQCIISPSDLQSIGFMLSYGALCGILVTNKFLTRRIVRILPPYLAASLSASCGAQLFTAPISLGFFGSFAPVGILATVIVSPLITIFIYSGLLLIVLCMIFPVLSSCSAIFLSFEYNVIRLAVAIFSLVPAWRMN